MQTDPLAAAAADYHQADEDFRFARETLHEQIRAATKAGRQQSEMVRVTGLHRETLRRVAAGLNPGG